MIRTIKVILYPTKEQEIQFRQFCGTSRFIYNSCLAFKKTCYETSGVNCNLQDLLSYIRSLKYSANYEWLQLVPEAVQKQSVKDLMSAYKHFFNNGGFPKFKKKGKGVQSFYQRTDKLHLGKDEDTIKLTGIKESVKFKNYSRYNIFECIQRPLNPRVKHDGKHWYLTFSFECESVGCNLTSETLGIDLGVKNLVTVSNGLILKNINKSEIIRKLNRKLRRLQRKISKKYLLNKIGGKFVKTNNIKKLERQIKLLFRRIANIRDNYIHNITSYLVRTKPNEIVIEDLNVSGMLKNRHLSRAISEQQFYKFREYLTYKCEELGIKLTVVDRFYPSSKLCSLCGAYKKILKLSDRIYKCENCGLEIDRDLNASLNLRNYALSH